MTLLIRLPHRAARSGWSLRFRVLALALILASAGLVVINVVSILTIRHDLTSRLDQQLKAVPRVTSPPPGIVSADRDPQFLSNLVIVSLDPRNGSVVTSTVGPQQKNAPAPDVTKISAAIASGKLVVDHLETLPGVENRAYGYRARILPSGTGDADVVVIAVSLADVRATVRRETLVDAIVSLAVLVALVGIGFPAVRLGLKPLVEVEHTAERIASGQLSSRAPHAEEATEVGRLARSFNRMLERIQDAFEQRDVSEAQLRRFVADASHELRTPLTSIRAYAELFRQGALPASADARQAISRIEAEAVRMGTMVDEMLLLARLDQMPELDRQPVDMGALVTEIVVDIRAAAPEHTVEVNAPIDGTASVLGDSAGLRGVMTNLIRNAVIHTPARTRVWIDVALAEDAVRMRVADDGPGMSADVATRVFDRFYRADPSREHAKGTTGLGLAIVDSMVKAHGGEVSLETTPGSGSTFSVVLPTSGRPEKSGSQALVREPPGVRQEDGGLPGDRAPNVT